jgi:hypothetical protein
MLRNDVSEELIASIIRVKIISELLTGLEVASIFLRYVLQLLDTSNA